MKLTLKILLASFLLFLLLLMVFFFWAGGSVVKKNGISGIRKLKSAPLKNGGPGSSYKIMTYNCGYFSGMMNNLPAKPGKDYFNKNISEFQKTAAEIKPDVICFQEIDLNSQRSHSVNQPEILGDALGFSHHAWAVNWNKRYVPFPYWPVSAHFGRMVSAQAVISKFPVIVNRRIILKKPENPFYYNHFYLNRLIQEVQVDMGGRRVTVMNIHLEAFERNTREEQARFVLNYYLKYHRNRGPVIILGDFNCVPPEALKMSGFPDEPDTDYTGEKSIEYFLNESSLAEAIPDGNHTLSTFPSLNPDRKLDYIFYTKKYIRFVKASVPEIHSSDHLPVLMEFAFIGESE